MTQIVLPFAATKNIVDPIEHSRRDGIGIVDRVELFCCNLRVERPCHCRAKPQITGLVHESQQDGGLRRMVNQLPDWPDG
ncbi:MAG: hypothetical protein E5V46_24215 [Mesorhizobium sp.]|nr:MAG: hypothetical protein E5V46_24215 [Mesorhizobium sp.]